MYTCIYIYKHIKPSEYLMDYPYCQWIQTLSGKVHNPLNQNPKIS